MRRTTLREDDDAPLHLVVVRWLVEYARAPDDERDGVVAEMLTELNALLQGRRGGAGSRRGRTAAG